MNENVIFSAFTLDELLLKFKEVVKSEVQNINTSPKDEPEELLDIFQVCKLTGACKATIHNWKRNGVLPFYRLGRKVRFKKNEVFDALKKVKRREVN